MDRNNHTKTTRWLAILVLLTMQILSANADVVTVWTTVKVPAPTPTAPLPPSYTSFDQFKDDMLKVTNEYRANHDADPLRWNETLADYSRKWAEACIWKHSKSSYGENLAFGFDNVSAAVIAWGDEGDMYNFGKPTGFTEETGHFTQLVWKDTTQVGCAAVNCGYKKDDNAKRDNEVEVQEDAFDAFEGVLMAPRFTEDESEQDGLEGLKVAARGEPRAQGWYVVCEYTPPGNVVGMHDFYFRKNVLPKKRPTVESPSASSVSSTASSTSSTSSPSSTSAAEPSSNAATSTTTGSQSRPTGSAMKFALDSTLGMMLVALGTVGVGRGLYA